MRGIREDEHGRHKQERFASLHDAHFFFFSLLVLPVCPDVLIWPPQLHSIHPSITFPERGRVGTSVFTPQGYHAVVFFFCFFERDIFESLREVVFIMAGGHMVSRGNEAARVISAARKAGTRKIRIRPLHPPRRYCTNALMQSHSNLVFVYVCVFF